MVTFLELALPILLAAVLVFIASSILWTATPLHKHDYKSPGDKEQTLLDAIRAAALRPGVYFILGARTSPRTRPPGS